MFFALFCLIASAWAATLPGLPLDFEMGPEGRWLLPAELPKAFQDAGVQPGWALSAVDGHRFDDPTATAKRVASGPARLIQLHFATPEGEVVVQVPRAPLISVDEIGLLPAPPDASLVGMRWEQGGGGQPLLVTQEGAAFLLDPATGGWSAARPSGLSADLPDVFWALANVPWAITRDGRLQLVDPDVARVDLKGAVRLRSFQGASAEHLVLPSADGLLVMRVSFPVGTAELPLCAPDFPETCLVAGRQIARDLRGVRGARKRPNACWVWPARAASTGPAWRPSRWKTPIWPTAPSLVSNAM